ncbi:hypothetical protein LAWI1_G001852 [Lachnellula willkommii]|uniref:Uncharacterized protein n=1 Tax=Lachnellula willkommii TaxID=215461 RepID=A0A559MHG7_9HELO|nr:hypothetical protein LAWI1_G001852 [Lachnellula willkommii]
MLLLLAYLVIISSASFSSWNHDQQLLHFHTDSSRSLNFSVGFSLQSSYGTAAVIFQDGDGELETYTRVRDGGVLYRQVMARLSLESSRHIAPPYDDDGQFWADQPRKALREALKATGLPASYEVGVLAHTIKHLRSQLEADFGIVVSEAVFTSSHLVALYRDDLEDVAYDAGIKYVTPKHQFKPILWETGSAYAGHGLGLCEHWRDEERCREEEDRWPEITVLAVHYSRNALTTSLASVTGATQVWEPDYRHEENFTLGSDGMNAYPSLDNYWADVRETLLLTMTTFPFFPKPEKILVTGDRAHGYFMKMLRETLNDYLGHVPPILSIDPREVSAKGAAEFMRRGPAPWS